MPPRLHARSAVLLRQSLSTANDAVPWPIGDRHPSVVASTLHIDRHEDRLGNRSVILAQCENTAPCRRHDTAQLFVSRNIVCPGSSAENVNFIVVPSHQTVGPEVANLPAAMTGDIVREYHFQPTPDLAVLLPWIYLAGLEASVGVEKRLREVRPHRITAEIRDVQVIPRALLSVAREGRTRVVASLNHLAGICFKY